MTAKLSLRFTYPGKIVGDVHWPTLLAYIKLSVGKFTESSKVQNFFLTVWLRDSFNELHFRMFLFL